MRKNTSSQLCTRDGPIFSGNLQVPSLGESLVQCYGSAGRILSPHSSAPALTRSTAAAGGAAGESGRELSCKGRGRKVVWCAAQCAMHGQSIVSILPTRNDPACLRLILRLSPTQSWQSPQICLFLPSHTVDKN